MSEPRVLLPGIDVLPDSRLTTISTPKNSRFYNGQFWEPIFCANCGADGGMVPEGAMTSVFWLCNSCFQTMGEITNTMVMPDEVFFAKVQQEAHEMFGRDLNEQELIRVVEEDASPLATLLKQGR